MRIFDGKKESEKILAEVREEVGKSKIIPNLAIVLIGESRPSRLYIKLKKQAAQRVGIKIDQQSFKETVSENEIIQHIISLNCDKSVHGIIVQLPLPKGFNAEKIVGTIAPEKDVDGFHRINKSLLERGKPFFFPVLPMAIFYVVKGAVRDLKNKKILALVNSETFGETLQSFFKREKIKMNYILRGKLSSSKLKSKLQEADVLISVCGLANFIGSDMIKDGAVLIDGGMSFDSNHKVIGDIDRESIKNKASFVAPVPGGIGPLTVAFLLKNVYLATKHHGSR